MNTFSLWCCTQLRDLNDDIDAKVRGPNSIAEAGARAVESYFSAQDSESLGKDDAGWLVSDIGMFISSCIAHGLAISHPTIIKCQELLKKLARNIEYPPRENTYTYILLNHNIASHEIRCFTHSHFEREFIFAFQRTNQLFQRAACALRHMHISDKDALEKIADAADALEAVEMHFRTMLLGATRSHADWFRGVYKSYFPSYTVDGVLWEAPSGAHLASVMELDLILGAADDARKAAISQRLRYLTPADRTKVIGALERPTPFLQIPNPLINEAMLLAIERVSGAFARVFGIHWALLNRMLVKDNGQEKLGAESGNVMTYGEVKKLATRRHKLFPKKRSLERI